MNILVVDDEDDVLYSLKQGLETIDPTYTIHLAHNGDECIKSMKKHIPDLILLDLMMPNMNGWQVLDIIQGNAAWREIPIFIITAVKDPEFKSVVENLGIVYIEKPLTIELIKDHIAAYFNAEL
jgi:putative two-component system response regulator